MEIAEEFYKGEVESSKKNGEYFNRADNNRNKKQ